MEALPSQLARSARTLLAAPRARRVPLDRWDAAAIALSALIASWYFWLKLAEYRGGAYSDDIFTSAQLALSWTNGRGFLVDARFGHMLRYHSYFALLLLAPLVKALGAPGLLVALSASAGASCAVAARLLRAHGARGPLALAFGAVVATAPLHAFLVVEPFFGFHIENTLVAPVLALLHAIRIRATARAFALALLVISVKEEMPILVAAVAGLALVEDFLAGGEDRWNRCALAILALAAVMLPALLALIGSVGRSVGSEGFERLPPELGRARQGTGALTGYVLGHLGDWVTSPGARRWALLFLCSSFGLFFVRPHAIVIGFPLSAITWLMQDPFTPIARPDRGATTVAFGACASALAVATLARWLTERERKRRPVALVVLAALPCVAISALPLPFANLKGLLDSYRLRPRIYFSKQDQATADAFFERYRQASGPGDPVATTPPLSYQARVEDLLFEDAEVDSRPPEWILWDLAWRDFSRLGLAHADYALVAQNGRFLILRRRATAPKDAVFPVKKR